MQQSCHSMTDSSNDTAIFPGICQYCLKRRVSWKIPHHAMSPNQQTGRILACINLAERDGVFQQGERGEQLLGETTRINRSLPTLWRGNLYLIACLLKNLIGMDQFWQIDTSCLASFPKCSMAGHQQQNLTQRGVPFCSSSYGLWF